MTPKKNLDIHSYGLGIGSHDTGCSEGPKFFLSHNGEVVLKDMDFQLNLSPIILADNSLNNNYDIIASACNKLGQLTANSINNNKRFLNLGGDQSGSAGTWSGAATGLGNKSLGLIWVDAHKDSHTPESSETGNIHGMPLAALMGYGDKRLTTLLSDNPKVDPQHVVLVGIRSYEKGEAELLKKLNVKVFYMEDIVEQGIHSVMEQAIMIAGKADHLGMAIDLDAFDPSDAPGVGTSEPNGIKASEFLNACTLFSTVKEQFVGLEIVEFNPQHDVDNLTFQLIQRLIKSVFESIL